MARKKGKSPYPTRKPNKGSWSLVTRANAFFGALGGSGQRGDAVPNKIAVQQDKLARHGVEFITRRNIKDKKWELYKKKRGK